MKKKILTGAAVLFLIFFVVHEPKSAADIVKSLGSGFVHIAQGFGEFFSSLFGK